MMLTRGRLDRQTHVTRSVSPPHRAAWRTPMLVILAGCAIAAVGFGARSALGLFLEPMTATRGWSRETFAMALALQNLFWGLGLPLAGVLADRLGASRVIMVGAVVYASGLWGMANVESAGLLHLFAGAFAGLGIAFSAFSLALAAMVKVVAPDRRTVILGLGTAAGSAGQVVFSPLSQGLIESVGWAGALVGHNSRSNYISLYYASAPQ